MRIRESYINILEKSDKIFSSFLMQGICILLYKILIDLIYVLDMAVAFGYGIRPNVMNIISSYLYIGIYTTFFHEHVKSKTASSIMFIVLYMIYFIPITTYCSLGTGSSGFLFFTILYWTLFSVLQIITPVVVLKRSEMHGRLFSFFMYFLLIGTGIFTVYLSWKYTGFRIMTSLLDVYEVRREASGYDMPVIFRYLQSFSTILIPMLMLDSFQRKKYFLVMVEAFLLILNFSFAGHKSVIFMGVLVLGGAIFWKKQMVSWILPGGIGLAILGIIERKIFSRVFILSSFFRRMGYLLAALSDDYYRYFKHNPIEIFRGTFLGKIGFGNPYRLPVSYVIGNNFFSQGNGANNGLLADVWSNLGPIGILIMPFILIVCFRFFDMASDGLSSEVVAGLAAYCAVMFSNGSWSTVLLSGGYLIMCAGFFMFPRDKGLTGEGK